MLIRIGTKSIKCYNRKTVKIKKLVIRDGGKIGCIDGKVIFLEVILDHETVSIKDLKVL